MKSHSAMHGYTSYRGREVNIGNLRQQNSSKNLLGTEEWKTGGGPWIFLYKTKFLYQIRTKVKVTKIILTKV
jgi:hypothetical protein